MRLLRWLIALAVVAVPLGLWLSRAVPLPEDALTGISGDAARGAPLFAAAGCASCHTAPDAERDGPLVLAGGRRFVSDFGTFVAPNISPDPDHGIGAWSDLDLANAIQRGVSPQGQHYYPAFPYTAYARADIQDVADIIAHLRTLPASDTPSQPQDVTFPFNIRRATGLWKTLYMSTDWVLNDALTDRIVRGRYLVEALGHCGECHTPRGPLGALDTARWLGGAANPVESEGRIPNITPAVLGWSDLDIVDYLATGFTPDFDSAGGEMAAVVRNTAQLTEDDRIAIAAYLLAIPDVTEDGAP